MVGLLEDRRSEASELEKISPERGLPTGVGTCVEKVFVSWVDYPRHAPSGPNDDKKVSHFFVCLGMIGQEWAWNGREWAFGLGVDSWPRRQDHDTSRRKMRTLDYCSWAGRRNTS